MIAYVKGMLVLKSATYVIIEAGGIGYHINISLNTYEQIPSSGICQLHTHFHVKEDVQMLYGFADTEEKELFVHLISVSGIGPTTAQIMLSSLKANEIQQAIVEDNEALIKSVKGIGIKTAKRLILELKDKLSKGFDPTLNLATSHNTYREEALKALLALGIAKPVAQKALNKLIKSKNPINSVESMIKEALKLL
ncbi:MAG: Holliday junction branch migration protein RuvA [Chitinophagales bacterium]